MKFEKIKPGMTLYDVGRHKMGNTTLSTVGVWSVTIISVDLESRSAVVSWNHNRPHTFYARRLEKLREKRPMLIRTDFGGSRLATREEQKAARASASAA